jgi:hypothetical protein
MWKILPPPGFDPRTVQPVASRYTHIRVILLYQIWSMHPTFHIRILSDILHTDSFEYEEVTLCKVSQVVHNIQFQKTVSFVSLAVYLCCCWTYCSGTV